MIGTEITCLRGTLTSITLGPKGNVKDTNIMMSNIEVKSGSEMRLLRLTIDANLNFNSHISDICKRASRKVGVLTRLQNLLPTRAKLKTYKTVILPQLTYCHIVWNLSVNG